MSTKNKLFKDLQKQIKGIKIAHDKAIEEEVATADREARPTEENLYIKMNTWFTTNHQIKWFHRIDEASTKGEWRKFNGTNACWEIISKSKVKKLVKNQLIVMKMNTKTEWKMCYEFIQDNNEEDPDEYDPSHLLLINEKKVIDSDTYEVIDFDPAVHKFMKCENLTLSEVDRYTEMIIENLMCVVCKQTHVKTIPFPFGDESDIQYDMLVQSLVNLMWNYQIDKTALCFIGPPNAAKTIIVNLIANIFPNSSGAFDITNLGENGGMANIYNKRYAYQNECNGGYLNEKGASRFKDIESNIKSIPIRVLYRNPFDYRVLLNILIAANQLPKLPMAFESDSTFKRFCILFTPNIFKKFPELEDLVQDQEFINKFFSYFISMEPQSIIDDLDYFIKRSRAYYQWSSRPIDRIINDKYIRDYDQTEGMIASLVYHSVEQALKESHALIPKSLTEQINKAVTRLGGDLKRNMKYVVGYDEKGKEMYEKHDQFVGISLKSREDRIKDETFVSKHAPIMPKKVHKKKVKDDDVIWSCDEDDEDLFEDGVELK